MGDKVRVRKGKPDHQPKVPKYMLSGKGCGVAQTTGCWLRSVPSFKECVIAH